MNVFVIIYQILIKRAWYTWTIHGSFISKTLSNKNTHKVTTIIFIIIIVVIFYVDLDISPWIFYPILEHLGGLAVTSSQLLLR